MRLRKIALLIGLYVALDFANPMLPGAVQLVDGSLEATAASQARAVDLPTQAITLLPRHLVTIPPPQEPRLPTGLIVLPARPSALLVRTLFEPRSTTASSSDDD